MGRMTASRWHMAFEPRRFLEQVDLQALLKRNEYFQEARTSGVERQCFQCSRRQKSGLVLLDSAFLCEECFEGIATVSYPEKYEQARRRHLIEQQARRCAREALLTSRPTLPERVWAPMLGAASGLAGFLWPWAFVLAGAFVVISVAIDRWAAGKLREWKQAVSLWDEANPDPEAPEVLHFHDPRAELTEADERVLRIFEYWPGYPPYWNALTALVRERDARTCQVTGCPSRTVLHCHHIRPMSEGGAHRPNNLVSLCAFHHALEPAARHERTWQDIRNQYFTLVSSHRRRNRAAPGDHLVRPFLRRVKLATIADLVGLSRHFGLSCARCHGTDLTFTLVEASSRVRVLCRGCGRSLEGPLGLPEETGPRLAELFPATQNAGRWKARWDVLAERRGATWKEWCQPTVAGRQGPTARASSSSSAPPRCPRCCSAMRLIRPGPTDNWRAFWGCSQHRLTGCPGKVEALVNRG